MSPAAVGGSGEAAWAAPWFDLVRDGLEQVGAEALAGRWEACRERIDRLAQARGLVNENGRPLRFVDAADLRATAYEQHIWRTGEVPTRCSGDGAWHDLMNALVWLALPQAKARLNRLQAERIAADGVGARRGGLRDAATLFDENAALLVTRDAGLVARLRGFDWRGLFVRDRQRFAHHAAVRVFGHALLDKLRRPYKAACAHVWVLEANPADAADAAALDARLAASLDSVALRPEAFTPLPVLGVPGWWPASESPAFYDDIEVFRPGRRAPRPACVAD